MTIGVARPCPPFYLGFDVLEPVTAAMLDDAIAHGCRWVGRYLNDLSSAEVARIFARGLGLLLYTEAMTSSPLSAATGHAYGVKAGAWAGALGVPPRVHVAIDLEDPAPASECGAHVNAMAGALLGDALGAALYIGVPQPLTGPELFALLPDRYIKGGGRATVPTCGWAALQLEPLEGLRFGGAPVDIEVTKLDDMGRALVLWWPA